MSDHGKAALARRYYLHVLDGGTLTPDDLSRLVQTIEGLEAALATARNDALEEAAERLERVAGRLCEKCGHPHNNHPFRHRFVGVTPWESPSEIIRVLKDQPSPAEPRPVPGEVTS